MTWLWKPGAGWRSGSIAIGGPAPNPVNRPANPGLLCYEPVSGAPASAWAHPGALVVAGRTNYNNAAFQTMAAGGATVLLYLNFIVDDAWGRYHDLLNNSSSLGPAVPDWPGSPVYNQWGNLNDFRVGGILQSKVRPLLELALDENPHIAGFFFDDLGTRAWTTMPWDSWSSTDKEAYRNGAIQIVTTARSVLGDDGFIMVNGTWTAITGTAGSGGYPTRNQHGNALANGGFVENHNPSTEFAFWSAYGDPDTTQWGLQTALGIGYMWFSNVGDVAARNAWVAGDACAYASTNGYTSGIATPWRSFTDFGLPRRP